MDVNCQGLILKKAKLEDLPHITDFVENWARKNGFNLIIPAVLTAVDEASTNIIRHSYADKPGQISVFCHREEDQLVIKIMDSGKLFNPETMKRPDINANLENRPEGGLGVYLIKKLMDEVTYTHDTKGNVLTMKKKLR